jgi:membrane-associated phospholipid phosphatase
MSGRPLLVRRAVFAAIAVAAFIAMLILGVRYAGTHGPGRLDRAIDSRIQDHFGDHPAMLQRLVNLANPGSAVVICALLCALFLATDRRRLAALVVLGPAASGVLVDVVLKPLFDRRLAGTLSYPSGHTAAAASIALVVVVSMLGPSRLAWPLGVRSLVAVCAIAAAGVIATALIAAGYHYTTDTIGGLLVAVACVLGVALSIDAFAGRPSAQKTELEAMPRPDDAMLPRVEA